MLKKHILYYDFFLADVFSTQRWVADFALSSRLTNEDDGNICVILGKNRFEMAETIALKKSKENLLEFHIGYFENSALLPKFPTSE